MDISHGAEFVLKFNSGLEFSTRYKSLGLFTCTCLLVFPWSVLGRLSRGDEVGVTISVNTSSALPDNQPSSAIYIS